MNMVDELIAHFAKHQRQAQRQGDGIAAENAQHLRKRWEEKKQWLRIADEQGIETIVADVSAALKEHTSEQKR